jgi:hypothetical protein
LSGPEDYQRLALEARERATTFEGIPHDVLVSVAETYELMARVQETFEAAGPPLQTSDPADEQPPDLPDDVIAPPTDPSSTER